MTTELERYAERIKKLQEECGLSDIKFADGDLQNATVEEFAAEANRLLDAIESGRFQLLEFNDSQHK